MKNININPDPGHDKQEQHNSHNAPENIAHKKFHHKIYHKLSNFAQRAKFFAKKHFPVRFWNKAQENKRGPKI